MMKRVMSLLLGALAASVPMQLLADDNALVMYSGRSDHFVRPAVEAFTERTGIPVTIHAAKSTELVNRLRVEGKRTDADLFISNDAGTLQIGSDFGLFHPLPQDLLQQVPDNYRAEDGTWVGLSARARVLVVNTNAKDTDFVQSVLDLADERLKGRLAITNSVNESYIAGVTVYQEALGDERVREWLQGLKRNAEGQVYNKHSQIVRDVAAGRKDVGLVNHYYIFRHLEKNPDAPVEIRIPDQQADAMGVAWNVAGIAVTRHSGHTDKAVQLVKFLLSPEGQKIFADVNREYPTRAGVTAADEVPAAGSYRVADVPMSALGKKRNDTLDLLEQVGMP